MRPFGYGPPGGSRPNLRFGPGVPVPPVVARLIGANVAVYFLQTLTGDWMVRELGLVPALVERGEIWRLFTYQFLHGGLLHLALNMLALWMCGTELAVRWRSQFFLRYYFLCALAGGIAFTLVRLGSWMPTVGASGAIYGILIAYAMWFPNRQVLLYFVLPIRVRNLIAFMILLDVSQAMLSSDSGVAHAAHLGGMAFGYAYLRWNGVDGLQLFSPSTIGQWKKSLQRWRIRRDMRSRGWNDRDTLH